MREIMNAVLYQNRTGCQWDLLPHDLPPAGAVKITSTSGATTAPIRPSMICCDGNCGRRSGDWPTRASSFWTRRVSMPPFGVPVTTTGREAAKKVPGRKRFLAVDTLGLVIAVVVLAASAHENVAGIALLDGVAE